MTGAVPTFAVVGAGRAGTTGLIEGLRGHPDVFVTDPKEPHYFALHGSRPAFRGPGDDQTINRAAVTDLAAYRALYPREPTHRALGEGSVSTLYYYDTALPELLRVNPDIRVVILLREPVARAYSAFQYLRAQGREPEEDFRLALDREPARRASDWHHLWHYAAMSEYAAAVAAFRERLPEGQVGVWFHDDLERDYAGTFAEVLDFLGLPAAPGVGEDVPRVNASGVPRSAGLQHALSWAAGRPALRRTARAVTSWRFREAVRTRLIRRDPVPTEIRDHVAPRFVEDLARLRDVLPATRERPAWLRSEERTRARR